LSSQSRLDGAFQIVPRLNALRLRVNAPRARALEDSEIFSTFFLVTTTFRGTMTTEYLTTEELALRIKYDPRTIRERLKDSVLIEGQHYLRPFGGRKILYLWAAIERDMAQGRPDLVSIPMANGGICHG